jgi:translation initiation factor 5
MSNKSISTCAACGTKELLALTHKLTVFILAQDKKKKKQKIYRKSDTKEINHWKKAQNSTCVLKVEIEQGEEEEVEVEAAAEDVSKVTLDDITDGMTAKEAVVNTLSKYFAAPSDGKTPEQVVEYIRSLQTGSSLMLKECAYIMIGAAFDQNVVKAGQVSVYAKILRALVATDANKFMARHIIGAVEDFFGSKYPSLAKAFPLVLKQLYDEDILEEEVILDWAGQGVTYEFSPQSMTGEQIKELRASAESFITWLKEADEDDDDADDEGL